MNVLFEKSINREDGYLFEYEAYELFNTYGIATPVFKYFEDKQYDIVSQWMKNDQDYVMKCQVPGCLHKTDINGVMLNVNKNNFVQKLLEFKQNLLLTTQQTLEGILLVEMQKFSTKTPTGGELLLSVIHDNDFGYLICFGFGGTVVEQLNQMMDDAIIFIPIETNLQSGPFRDRIHQMPVSKYLLGEMRGIKQQIKSLDDIIYPIINLQKLISSLKTNSVQIQELEINPIVITDNKLVALDGVVKVFRHQHIQPVKPLYNAGLFVTPQTILLAGVSSKNPDNPCTKVLTNLMKCKLKFKIFCLHPKETEVMGFPAYPTLKELREAGVHSVDLFVCGVAAASAMVLLRDIAQTGFAKTNFILTGGFGETEEGKKYEFELRSMLKQTREQPQHYPLMNGANTLGYLWQQRVNTIFVENRKNSAFDVQYNALPSFNKNVALICQSGACMISRMSNLAYKVQPLFNMSVGNQICMSAVDFLDWLLCYDAAEQFAAINPTNTNIEEMRKLDIEKKDIKVFGLYIEGFNESDGERLVHLVPRLKAEGKHIVIYKAARTEQGKHAAAGHTASMSGSYSMCQQILETLGCIICPSFNEFEDVLYLTSHFTRFDIRKPQLSVGVITNAGFEKCCYADHLFAYRNSSKYVKLPDFSPETKERLVQAFQKYKLSLVVDIDQILDTTPTIPDLGYIEFAQILIEADDVDVIVISPVPESHMMSTVTGEVGVAVGRDFMTDADSFPQLVVKHLKDAKKPVVCSIESGWKYDPLRKYLMDNGFPVFDHSDSTARAINAAARSFCGQW